MGSKPLEIGLCPELQLMREAPIGAQIVGFKYPKP